MERVQTDPLVSCPIVCGEYMRASAFFYSDGRETYLVTARHNALPMTGPDLKSGEMMIGSETDDYLPQIDVYLRSSGEFDVHSLDLREVSGVLQSPEIDVLMVPFDGDPATYGYTVFEEEDVTPPHRSSESLKIIGFDGISFPKDGTEYSVTRYADAIAQPAALPIINYMEGMSDVSKFGLLACGIDAEFVGTDKEYTGMSGAPVVDDGLVGIHGHNYQPPAEVVAQADADEYMQIIYTRGDVIPAMLS